MSKPATPDVKTSPTVLTLLTGEQLRAIVFDAVREAMGATSAREQQVFNTTGAAKYLETTVAALHMQVQRGVLKPDAHGGRGRFRGYRFKKATLDAYLEEKG